MGDDYWRNDSGNRIPDGRRTYQRNPGGLAGWVDRNWILLIVASVLGLALGIFIPPIFWVVQFVPLLLLWRLIAFLVRRFQRVGSGRSRAAIVLSVVVLAGAGVWWFQGGSEDGASNSNAAESTSISGSGEASRPSPSPTPSRHEPTPTIAPIDPATYATTVRAQFKEAHRIGGELTALADRIDDASLSDARYHAQLRGIYSDFLNLADEMEALVPPPEAETFHAYFLKWGGYLRQMVLELSEVDDAEQAGDVALAEELAHQMEEAQADMNSFVVDVMMPEFARLEREIAITATATATPVKTPTATVRGTPTPTASATEIN